MVINVIDFVEELSKLLCIETPAIDHDTSYFQTDTQLACVSFPNCIIHIRKGIELSYDLMFSIAHEIRHVWQYTYKVYNFDEYVYNNDTDINKYNLQEAEIDAHAFSIMIMKKMFNVQPQLESILNRNILNEIKKRMDEIAENEFIDITNIE